MKNRELVGDDNWPDHTRCQWLISAQEDNEYVTLEFQNLNVKRIALKKNCIPNNSFNYYRLTAGKIVLRYTMEIMPNQCKLVNYLELKIIN